MGKLTTAQRNKLPDSDFAGSDGSYPIPDQSHARNALARVSQFGSSDLKAKVRAKVKQKYPGIKVSPVTPSSAIKGRKGIRGKRTAYKR